MTAKENRSGNNGAITGFKENAVQLTNELPEQFVEARRLEADTRKPGTRIRKNLKGLEFDV